jgi:C-lobe and N-lobe beta barrels of Tf-binding protein B
MRTILMRVFALALCTSMLAACSGAGPQTIGNIPAPNAPGAPTTQHTFVNPTEQKVYNAIGGSHTFQYAVTDDLLTGSRSSQTGQLYQGNASTVRRTGIIVDYNPRDAIFDITIKDPLSGVSTLNRFQDPIHRTNFGGAREPQTGIPNLTVPGIQYLESGIGSVDMFLTPNTIAGQLAPNRLTGSYDITSYFYQKPGTTTKFVTFSGYIKNNLSLARSTTSVTDPTTQQRVVTEDKVTAQYKLERGAFVFGENTNNQNVPKTGTGSYSGTMLATMVFDDQADLIGRNSSTYFQWVEGTSDTKVDFLSNTFNLTLAGRAFNPQLDLSSNEVASILDGARFNANGSGRIDLAAAGGFLGQFQQAWFVNPNGTRIDFNIAGSSIDGAFYGPAAQEVGGGYRIVGGTPDQRIDLLGVFVGK